MKLTACRILTLLYLICNLTACGTAISLSKNDYGVYSGVGKDIQTLQEGGICAIFAVIDLPLSFVLDTLLLPVAFTQ